MKDEKELKKILGKNISIRRKRMGFSQEKLADKADLSKNTISDIEKGDKFASATTLVNLAKVLQTEVYELLKPENVSPDNAADIITKYSNKVKDAVEKLEKNYIRNMKK